MSQPTLDPSKAVTVVVQRHVKPGSEEAYEELLRGMLDSVVNFPGYLGASVMRPPASGAGPYRFVLRFDNAEHLAQWSESDERSKWMRCLASVTIGEPDIRTLSGMETWFAAHSNEAIVPPPRYKMVAVALLASYPIMTLLIYLAQHYASHVPLAVRTLITSSLMLIVMTYGAMPLMTRLFSGWLYPPPLPARDD
jgi:uncharacterized protein